MEETLGEGEFGKVVSARANNFGDCSGKVKISLDLVLDPGSKQDFHVPSRSEGQGSDQ